MTTRPPSSGEVDATAPMCAEVNYRGVVYPWQCDHVGHMNVMWYVGKFDEAAWNFVSRLGLTPRYMRESACGPAAVKHDVSYKREMFAGDIIEITSRILRVGDRSICFVNEMRDAETGELTATCEVTAVHINRETRKSAPWPSHIRQAAEQRLAVPDATSAGLAAGRAAEIRGHALGQRSSSS